MTCNKALTSPYTTQPPAPVSTDLMYSVNGMFRALELVSEEGRYGVGGLINKVLISQESLQAFINELSPGAYSSMTKVDFKTLDEVLIKPAGLYGSKSEIVAFLAAHGAVDELTAHALRLSKDNSPGPSLSSGLYLLRSFGIAPGTEQIFVIYWPEDTTWDDNTTSSTISRNRETFMRYLTKICDQVTCLISEEHAHSIVWSDDSEDAATNEANSHPSRLYKFTVSKTNEQEESVVPHPGFKITMPTLSDRDDQSEHPIDRALLKPKLISGETRQGLLMTQYVPAGLHWQSLKTETYSAIHLEKLLDSVELGAEIPDTAVEALMSVSSTQFQTRYGPALNEWKARNTEEKRVTDDKMQQEDRNMLSKITDETEGKREVYKQAVVESLLDYFPIISHDELSTMSDERRQQLRAEFLDLCNNHRFIKGVLDKTLSARKADVVKPEDQFRLLKHNLTYIDVFLQCRPDLKGSRRAKTILELSSSPRSLISSQNPARTRESTGHMSSLMTYASRFLFSNKSEQEQQDQLIRSQARQRVDTMLDAEFLAALEDLEEREPALHEIISQTRAIATGHIKGLVDKLLRAFEARVIRVRHDAFKADLERIKAKSLAESRRNSARLLREDMQKQTPLAALFHNCSIIFLVSYKVQGFQRQDSLAYLDCQIHLLNLTSDERQNLQMNRMFIPHPQVMPQATGFHLDPKYRIVHAQLIENGELLLVLEDPTHISIYLERLGRLHLDLRRPRKTLPREKLGENPIIAYDESIRMLLLCDTTKLRFHLYVFDENYNGLQGPSTVDVEAYYAEGAAITHTCFVAGRSEILAIDTGNAAKIYSLVPQQFRPATVYLPRRPVSAYSSPDGACLLLSYPEEFGLSFRAYHWDSWGSTQGIGLGILDVPSSSISLTSMVTRWSVHLMGIDDMLCKSVALDITKKTTDFMFKETAEKNLPKARHNTVTHNNLIDCHSEVWARFPVVAAVQRQTIISSKNRLPRSLTFSTHSNHAKFASRFDDLINAFERRTRKPTGNELKKIGIRALNFDEVTRLLSNNKWAVSEFRAGEWLVDLLCLIPIQIAVTQENRFVPLKDGKVSLELEQRLLGAEVGHIVDSLSLGWYESVFQSYMASKPIKVVSSMGEQSVGKSFCLNHLVDTSFAGSAMRTTEGVWMSVTPTNETLIVALDFEGVHSIERSAQEDTLLVLFNTAISNLVLFRNNFAMSRSITGLFQSFQSSSTVLDPAANPQLFRSTLVIIIKDVVDSDEQEIVREYAFKIVQDEKDANFISRLHAGRLDIIPWPVIESRGFYALFPTLIKTLAQQEVTHSTAGEFLHTLKTLMAKLKANDWGALSETLAAHRAQKLSTYLNSALELGFYETEPVEPLKNFDTDTPIDQPDTTSRFFLSASNATPEERQNFLAELEQSWDQFELRHQTPEADWIAGLSRFLLDRAEMRIEYVFHWIKSNLARFKSNNANMDVLRRDFDSGAVDLRANVEICRMQCASCNLLCLLGRRHGTDTPHDCGTSHHCPHPCEFEYEHAELEKCGYPAGHPGKHICVVGRHLCGEPCVLEDKKGCMKKCTKVAKHSDDEHMCAARVHACGEPCSLQHLTLGGNKTYSCPHACTIPSHENHAQHVCATRSCPMVCELCKRLCVDTDHLHGLQANARHLCGQEHACAALCQADGICQIDTTPQSIEATFTGRHETFQYTKYSQDAKRLLCAIKIPPGERGHHGPHIHSDQVDPFHFCETRCLNCGYFCTLPLGHPQVEHDTSHGSMSRTSWAIDGPDDTILELKGRKFAGGDDGAPMMCNLLCQDLGRHVHVDYCRGTADAPCVGAEVEHIDVPLSPNPDQSKDWISHSLFWKRSDPYSRDDQTNFAKCEYMCPGPEHSTANPPAHSYCILPVLHAPAAGQVYVAPADPNAQSYISSDGHSYACKDPAEMQPAYHVYVSQLSFRSWSMSETDLQPLPNRPGADLIVRHHRNRLGAVFSALHAFWVSRSSAFNPGQPRAVALGGRKDAYSLIFFDHGATVCLRNDTNSTPDQLLHSVLQYTPDGGTDSVAALSTAEDIMRDYWSDTLAPVVIFLSDGECSDAQGTVVSLSSAAVDLGIPLSFHSVLFGTNHGRQSLSNMAQFAQEIQDATANNTTVPSSFTEALDEVRLAQTFLGFAESLRKPRGFLLR
ncbi:hypothetical protein C8F04DRAFT_981687 [Mycena alexandri]|uniref:Guanylate-binding protein N-terminal domain-containing protein n=1 Tax=Mycena alexandri TaxID=1745969 RepID=A0AAD6RW43_9AGAR|nr:hypothetical protein C8F04DRAFT_981687 [Mycena alexandri]